MIQNPVTHYIAFDARVGGWVVIARLPTGNQVVSRPRKPNAADDKRMEFNRATAIGCIPLYEQVDKKLEIPAKYA